MSCETMSFRRYGERRQRRQCCVRRPQVGQPASYLSIQLPIVAQLLAHDACFLRSTEDPVHGRAGSHPKSLFRALSLSLPPSKPSPPPRRRRNPLAAASSPFLSQGVRSDAAFSCDLWRATSAVARRGVAVLLLSAGELLRAPREPAPERLVRWSYLTLLFSFLHYVDVLVLCEQPVIAN
jgi:hypothetical protein